MSRIAPSIRHPIFENRFAEKRFWRIGGAIRESGGSVE
jgi:hypothetical protein